MAHAQHAFCIVVDLVQGKSPFERFHLNWEKPPPILPGFSIDKGEGSGFFSGEFSPSRPKKKKRRAGESNKGIFGNLKTIRHILRKKA
jgi:hypothetical protein